VREYTAVRLDPPIPPVPVRVAVGAVQPARRASAT
jgi:hypothetical protein